MEETEVRNYADGTTIYVCGNNLKHIVSSLETDAQTLSKWFLDDNMKLNAEKCHLLIFGKKNPDVSVQIGVTLITESVEEKLLGIMLDKHPDFKSHVNSLCKKLARDCMQLHVIQTRWMLRN